MSSCPIDHSTLDVKNKYTDQLSFLPEEVVQFFDEFFKVEQEQLILNEAFHLLKKYDLATVEEQARRNNQILKLEIKR